VRITRRFFDRSLIASKWVGPITPRVTDKIQGMYAEARLLTVILSELTDEVACGSVTFGRTSHVVHLNNNDGTVVCTCCKEKELGRLCKPALAVLAQIERQIRHPSRPCWGFKDPKWTSRVFYTETWRSQLLEPFSPWPVQDLAKSDLLLWRTPPVGKGRQPKPGRILSAAEVVEAQAGNKRLVRCGSCQALGHNRKNCTRINLDVMHETIIGSRVRTATPLTPPPAPRVRQAQSVQEGGWSWMNVMLVV
jgi:hypothetical protein